MPPKNKIEVFQGTSLDTDIKKVVTAEQRHEVGKILQTEYELCGRDLFYFATHVKTFDEDNDCVRGFPTTFPYLRRSNKEISEHQAVVILKSRRLLISWLGMLRQLHGAVFCGTGLPETREVFEGAIFTIGERQAIKMMDRVRFMWKNLPQWVQDANPLEKDTQLIMRWQKGGVVAAFPHAQDAPRGSGFSEVFFDEMAFQMDVRALWKSLIPTLGKNGKIIAVSTPNGRQNLFADVWHNKNEQFDGIHRIALTWQDNPEHDRLWYDALASKMEKRDVLRELELSFSAADGDIVFDSYDPTMHEISNTMVIPARPMLIGWDFGYRFPATVFGQYNSVDQYVFHREYRDFDKDFISYNKDVRDFCASFFNLHNQPIIHFVDPAGFQTYSSPSNSGAMCDVEEIRKQWGDQSLIYPGALDTGTRNNEGPRLKAVRKALKMRTDGRPGLIVNKLCVDVCTAFSGDYCYPKNGGEAPEKAESSHPMDAIQYLITGHQRIGEIDRRPKEKKKVDRIGHRTGL